MSDSKPGRFALAAGSIVVVAILALWSFNTVSELFGGPVAQLKHVLAAAGLLLGLRILLAPRSRHGQCRHAH